MECVQALRTAVLTISTLSVAWSSQCPSYTAAASGTALLQSQHLLQGEHQKASRHAPDSTFKSARPGSCCTSAPSTSIVWSSFEATPEAAANLSMGLPLVIPCGTEVLVDGSPSQSLAGLQVLGSLRFQDGVDVSLDSSYIFVCGNFSIGSPTQRHQARVEITLRDGTDLQWQTPSGDVKSFGKAGFVTYGGSIYLRGSACDAAPWTHLAKPAAPMSARLTRWAAPTAELELEVQAAGQWQPGDQLLVTSTGSDSTETEVVAIAGVSGNRVQLRDDLAHCHEGRPEACSASSAPDCVVAAEVASLSRNIVIKGESDCAPTCGHFMIAHTEHGFVCGVEFTNLGQTEVEGRYPLHFHLAGEAPSLVARSNALHGNHNRGVVLHGVHNMTVEANVCAWTKGHCFMTEDGVEQYNRIRGNLGVVRDGQHFGCSSTHDSTFTCAHRSDHNPNAFWISNPNNFIDDNVGLSSGGAFFFETRHVMGLVRRSFHAEAMKVGTRGKIKGQVPIASFRGNMAHSSGTGVGNYPRMSFQAPDSRRGAQSKYENLTLWRCGVGIAVHNTQALPLPIVGAKLIENTIGASAGTPTARVQLISSQLTAGETGPDGTGKARTVPFIMNAMGKTEEHHLPPCFASTDEYTLNWARCYGGYTDLGVSRFFNVLTNTSTMVPCSQVGLRPAASTPAVCPAELCDTVPELDAYECGQGTIGGYARGDRTERSLTDSIVRCDELAGSCGGITCSVDLVCTVRQKSWIGGGPGSESMVSYLKSSST